MTKSAQEALKKYKQYQRALENIRGDKYEDEEATIIYEKMDELCARLPENERRKIIEKSPEGKIIGGLVKLTTVPLEKSVIKWQMDKVFNQYYFKAEYKGKVYSFDGRHFYVYPTGYEPPPGIRIGEKQGPDLLLHARFDARPQLFGELWQVVCGQHEKELQEDARKEREYNNEISVKQTKERKRILSRANDILKDFK